MVFDEDCCLKVQGIPTALGSFPKTFNIPSLKTNIFAPKNAWLELEYEYPVHQKVPKKK